MSPPPARVRFSPEVSRSHSPDYWAPSPDTDDPRQQMLAKPPLSLPLPSARGRRRRADDDGRGRGRGRGAEAAWMRLPMTITLVAVLMVFAVGFGIIFWENEAEGSGE